MSPAVTPTPLPPDCGSPAGASMWNRTIAVLSSPAWIDKIVDVTPDPEPPDPAGATLFFTSVSELAERVPGQRRPLVLLHAGSLRQAELEAARKIAGLPGAPLVAVLGESEQMHSAFAAARALGLGEVFPDDSLQDRRELCRWANWMERGGPPPGLEPHLEMGASFWRASLREREDKAEEIESAVEFVKSLRPDPQFLFDLRLVLEETINNSIFHAFHGPDGREKYSIDTFRRFEESETVQLAVGADSRTIGVAVTDNRGALARETILAKIERHLSAQGVLDQNGRGLYLVYSLAGRLIFNLTPGEMTQLVALFPASPMAWQESPILRPLLVFHKPQAR